MAMICLLGVLVFGEAEGEMKRVLSEDGERPARAGTWIGDMERGMGGAMGVVAGINERDKTGKGCRSDASLCEIALGWKRYRAAGYFGTGRTPKRPST